MITKGNWQDALEPIAEKNAQLGFKEVPADRALLWNVKKASKFTETYLELGDIGSVEEFTGDLPYDDVKQGHKMTVSQRQFAKGIKIQRIFVETDQLDVVEGLPKLLGLAARRRMAVDTFAHLNNADNTTYTTIDGAKLCSATHTDHANQGAASHSNRSTTALSAPQVEAIRILMKAYTTNKENLFEVNPDMLIVPRALEETAYEIINASGKVDTANNNPNFHKGKYKLLVSDWLDDSNNWFMVDSELLKMFCDWNQLVPLEFKQADDFDGIAAKYRMYMAYSFVSRDYRWVHGNIVS